MTPSFSFISYSRWRAHAAAALLTAIASVVSAHAQAVGGAVQGTVSDASGAALTDAQVTIVSIETGAVREFTTDAGGRYVAPLLPPGAYDVHVAREGFQPAVERGLTLALGQTAVLDFTLPIGRVAEEATARWSPPRIDTTSGAQSGLVNDKEIRELPLNGRSFQQLALLQPGVVAALAAGNDVVGGRTPKISINGARPEQSSFLLDGTDINNVYNKTPGSSAGVLLGVEAVREFQVLTNAYSAEFGRSAGGVINAVTRSGTNDRHGTLFEFYRNAALDAKNYFDPKDEPIPPFFRHQFGGVAGGPIVRSRTFYFAAVESLVERLGVTGVTAVPDDNARLGLLPGRTVPLHPAIPAYLEALFPHANGASLGGGAAEYLFSARQPTDEYFGQMRVDHRFASGDSLFVRYTLDDGRVDRTPANKPPISLTRERSRNQYLTAEHQHVMGSTRLNTLSFGVNRSVSHADNVRTIDIPPSLSWLPGEKFGYLTITGLVSEMAGDFRLPRNDDLTNWQLADTLFWTRARHTVKVGVQSQFLQFHQNTTSQQGGIVTFPNLEAFLRGRPSTADFAVPGLIDPIRDYRQRLFASFVQDDVRVSSTLTMNLGLRHEFVTTPTEINGKITNLRQVADAALTIGDPWHSNPSLKNFAPRIGLAWDPAGRGRTSVRGGFGLFYDEILPKYYFFSGSLNPPFTTRTSIANPPFPEIMAGFDPAAPVKVQLQTVNYDLKTPFIMQFNAGVQQVLPGGWDLSVAYVGSRGRNLFRIGDANLAPEVVIDGVKTYQPQFGRRNPKFGPIFQRATDARSFYDSLQLGAVRQLANGVRAQFSYTLARSIDDASGINSQDFDNNVQYGLDWYDPEYDRGPSAFQARHTLVFNGSWDIGGGWQVNNVTTLQSGQPFTVRLGFNRSGNLNTTSFSMNERPDLVPGHSSNPVLGGPDRYFDVDAFALPAPNTRGNLGRNTLVGPGLINSDFALVKTLSFARARALQLRLEVFNAFNRANFAIPSGRVIFTNAAGDVAPNAGRITSTVTTARQVQLGLKWMF